MQAKAPALRVNHCPVQSLLHAAQQAFQPPPRAHQYTRALKLPETAEKSAEPKGYLLQMALQLPEQQFELSTKGCCCSPRCEWWLWRLTEHRTGKKKQTNQNASVKLQTWLKVPVCGTQHGGTKATKGKGAFPALPPIPLLVIMPFPSPVSPFLIAANYGDKSIVGLTGSQANELYVNTYVCAASGTTPVQSWQCGCHHPHPGNTLTAREWL